MLVPVNEERTSNCTTTLRKTFTSTSVMVVAKWQQCENVSFGPYDKINVKILTLNYVPK